MSLTYAPEGLKDAEAATPRGPHLGPFGWLRWTWRQLTSMRVALLLLLLLAVVALPGSFFPQRSVDAQGVVQYYADHPSSAPWLERLGIFDVYASPWFSAVYLLLFLSLIGCIVPRTRVHLRALRAQPTRVPRSFSRFPVRNELTVAAPPEQVRDTLMAALGRRYRRRAAVERRTTASGATSETLTVSAERGYGRESGNLLFHLALVGLLTVTAWGQLVHYRGQALVIEGDSFVNSALGYDSFDSGAWFAEDSLEPFRFRLDSFESVFTDDAQARDFTANVTVSDPDGSERADTIRVNYPLAVGEVNVYLVGNGYAPDLTVRDASGQIAFSGPVPFLPTDNVYTSNGVVMVPDANGGESQLGFKGTLLPTAVMSSQGRFLGSAYPQPIDPVIVLDAYVGDLGLDDGVPQNLYVLDTERMTLLTGTDDAGRSEPFQVIMRPGEEVELPDGQGSITFNALPRFVALDLRRDPSVPWMGLFAALAFAGLIGSLFLPRRRVWARLADGGDGTTVVTAAALARGDDPVLRRELERLLDALGPRTKEDR